jgi:hypothetical protein
MFIKVQHKKLSKLLIKKQLRHGAVLFGIVFVRVSFEIRVAIFISQYFLLPPSESRKAIPFAGESILEYGCSGAIVF